MEWWVLAGLCWSGFGFVKFGSLKLREQGFGIENSCVGVSSEMCYVIVIVT